MHYYTLCAAVFSATYLLNITYITVFYHRGLTHGAVRLSPWTRALVVATGNWITGLDPKSWACMHRQHHLYSDTPRDPHSPHHAGMFGLMRAQLMAYNRTMTRLIHGDAKLLKVAADLDFPVSWLNRRRLWFLPYLAHVLVTLVLGLGFGYWCLGIAYITGMMSHPVQGWMVNAFGHSHGYRTYATGDQSRNNTLVAWLVMGEGFQNNHHRFPGDAKFSKLWFEVDIGYGLCLALERLGVLDVTVNTSHRAEP